MHSGGVLTQPQYQSSRRGMTTIAVLLLTACVASGFQTPGGKWKDALRQNANWYKSAEAISIADNLTLYQRETGGWPKNIDMATPLNAVETAKLVEQKNNLDST